MVKSSSVATEPWVPAVLGVTFAFVAHDLMLLYHRLQWSAFARHTLEFGVFAQRDFEFVLGRLGYYRTGAAVIAVLFAFWALCFRPRRPGLVTLVFVLIAILDAARIVWL